MLSVQTKLSLGLWMVGACSIACGPSASGPNEYDGGVDRAGHAPPSGPPTSAGLCEQQLASAPGVLAVTPDNGAILMMDPSECAEYAFAGDERCADFAATAGIEGPLAFFSTPQGCGCECVDVVPEELDPRECTTELREAIEGTSFGEYTVSDDGMLLMERGDDCYEADLEGRCAIVAEALGYDELAGVIVEGPDGTRCGCQCVDPECITDDECDDGNACTQDVCADGVCEYEAEEMFTACDGGVCDGESNCAELCPEVADHLLAFADEPDADGCYVVGLSSVAQWGLPPDLATTSHDFDQELFDCLYPDWLSPLSGWSAQGTNGYCAAWWAGIGNFVDSDCDIASSGSYAFTRLCF